MGIADCTIPRLAGIHTEEAQEKFPLFASLLLWPANDLVGSSLMLYGALGGHIHGA